MGKNQCFNMGNIAMCEFFFLETTGGLRFISLRREIVQPSDPKDPYRNTKKHHETRCATETPPPLGETSRPGGATHTEFRGVPLLQQYTKEILGEAPLKTQSLRCFHISHATRIIKEFSPFFTSLGVSLTVLNHQLDKRFIDGCSAAAPIQPFGRLKTILARKKHKSPKYAV